jgi:hypothetical protein
LQGNMQIRTERVMKKYKHTLHEMTTHVPKDGIDGSGHM